MGLDGGILGEHVTRLGGNGQPEFARRNGLDAERSQKLLHLAQFASVVGGDDDLAGERAVRAHATAFFWRSTSWATPALASRSRLRNSSSEKGLPSAVPCTSTMPPEPVITKLASVSAAESSA